MILGTVHFKITFDWILLNFIQYILIIFRSSLISAYPLLAPHQISVLLIYILYIYRCVNTFIYIYTYMYMPIESGLCPPNALQYGFIHWSLISLRVSPLKENESPLPSSHRLTIAPQVGLKFLTHFSTIIRTIYFIIILSTLQLIYY